MCQHVAHPCGLVAFNDITTVILVSTSSTSHDDDKPIAATNTVTQDIYTKKTDNSFIARVVLFSLTIVVQSLDHGSSSFYNKSSTVLRDPATVSLPAIRGQTRL